MSATDLEKIEAQLREIRELLAGAKLERALYPLSEAAQLLGIGMTKMREVVRSGVVMAVDFDGRKMIPASEIKRVSTPTDPPRAFATSKPSRSLASFVKAAPPARLPKSQPRRGTQDRAALEAELDRRLGKKR